MALELQGVPSFLVAEQVVVVVVVVKKCFCSPLVIMGLMESVARCC